MCSTQSLCQLSLSHGTIVSLLEYSWHFTPCFLFFNPWCCASVWSLRSAVWGARYNPLSPWHGYPLISWSLLRVSLCYSQSEARMSQIWPMSGLILICCSVWTLQVSRSHLLNFYCQPIWWLDNQCQNHYNKNNKNKHFQPIEATCNSTLEMQRSKS